jgi:hypothetical protein
MVYLACLLGTRALGHEGEALSTWTLLCGSLRGGVAHGWSPTRSCLGHIGCR